MSARVYVLLNVTGGSPERVAQMIGCMPGVVSADCMEDCPDIVAVMEATDRLELAQMMMAVLAKVDGFTEDLHIMVARDGILPIGPPSGAVSMAS